MTLALSLIIDLHQDGLRVHCNTDTDGEELRLTGPFGESMSVPFEQRGLLRDMLAVADLAIELRRTYPGNN